MLFNQGEFNFEAPEGENGYSFWLEDIEKQVIRIEQKWGIRLGIPLRLSLKNYRKQIVGKVNIAPQFKGDPLESPPLLKIKAYTFVPSEVESFVVLD